MISAGFRDARGRAVVGRAAEVRAMDQATIAAAGEGAGLPGEVLMELAGAGVARLILERAAGQAQRVVVLCGGGNNGGDGYVIARHLAHAAAPTEGQGGASGVVCVAPGDTAKLRGDAALNHRRWLASGGRVLSARGAEGAPERQREVRALLERADVVVDALFGTGLARPMAGTAGALIHWANDAPATRVAVDLPSGVAADTGEALGGLAFRADLTGTFGVLKPGLLLQPGAAYAGEVYVVSIGLPRAFVDAARPGARWLDEQAAARLVPPRPRDAHKGTFGHVGVVGGYDGREGAGQLAARGALRAGAGLATWARPKGPALARRAPEVMAFAATEAAPLPPRPTVLVVGPGLGVDAAGQAAVRAALGDGRPLVLDADALTLLSREAGPPKEAAAVADRAVVLTPHPAEAARLLGVTTAEVQGDRVAAARAIAARWGAVCVLKGAGTVVASPDADEPVTLVTEGDPTLSTGGTGDVLAGVVGALLAQGLAPRAAAELGAWVHGRAGVVAGVDRGQRGVLASEVADQVPQVMADLALGWG